LFLFLFLDGANEDEEDPVPPAAPPVVAPAPGVAAPPPPVTPPPISPPVVARYVTRSGRRSIAPDRLGVQTPQLRRLARPGPRRLAVAQPSRGRPRRTIQ